MLEKIFKLKQNNTTVKTEILDGLTTFMTMAYIIALNPNLLTGFGAEGTKALWNGVFLATCIASAVGMFVMAFLANKPFALAPGMGLNSFFAVVVANIVSIYNPQTIILSDIMALGGERLLNGVCKVAKEQVFPALYDRLIIRFSHLFCDPILLGAMTTAANRFLDNPAALIHN